MRVLTALSVVVALVVNAAGVQDQPNFSGRWQLVDPAGPSAGVAEAMTVRQPVVSTTARGTPMPPAFLELTVERRFGQTVRTNVYKLGVEGGIYSGGRDGMHQESYFSATWRGDHLYITTRVTGGPTPDVRSTTAHTEDWSFDERGRLVIVVADREGDALPTLQTLTYTRSP
jgi:hypothetical protein